MRGALVVRQNPFRVKIIELSRAVVFHTPAQTIEGAELQNFIDLEDLASKIAAFIAEWNQVAHPFNWSTKSFEKILPKAAAEIAQAA